MVNTELHQHGEEYVIDLIINSGDTYSVGLYNDSTDSLGDTSDISDISTEPSGSAYSRQDDAATDFTASLVSDDVQMEGSTLTFDVSDSSQTVDSVFVVVNYTSDLISSDGSATDHLFYTNALDQSYDLDQFSSTADLNPTTLTLS